MMVTVVIVLLFSVVAMLALVRAARGHAAGITRIEELPQHTHPVDLDAFRNLMDPSEERYLRENLPPREFRRVQRLRLRAGVEYVQRTVENAAVLLRLGEAARRNPDPAVAAAAQELVASAVMVRIMGLAVILELRSRMLVPGSGWSPVRLIQRYQQVTDHVALLGRLQAPAAAARISSAL